MNTVVERGTGLLHRFDALLASIPPSLALLVLRIALAVPFFRSGLTKWDGFLSLSPSVNYLFANEFKLHLFGQALDFPFPTLAAWGSSLGEIVFPVLLVAGLFTRFAAFGVLLMTAVIQLTIPDGWANFHLPWAAMALALVVYGGGRISADALLPAVR
ncbi:DoxX family protein [Neoaquamicrobium sediminum]|uniref:DoxX family protein n=1 Tax=Neoaquamicrobium sediminum TaxID=1849104 RepID=A0ABV3WWP3_9HYPH